MISGLLPGRHRGVNASRSAVALVALRRSAVPLVTGLADILLKLARHTRPIPCCRPAEDDDDDRIGEKR
jgi:hypothetical protein